MSSIFNTTELKKHLSYEDQVREVVRAKILSGEFLTGEKIPSSREIAASLGTSLFTVHRALSALQNEGLLMSYPRRGIFVQKRAEKLTCVGGYSGMSIKQAPFAHAVREALREELRKDGIQLDLWVDPRPADQWGEPLKPLIQAAEQRRFQGFIATEVNAPTLQWQRKLPMPTAFLGAGPSVSNNVDVDIRQFVETSLRELANQGCRSVGFIAPVLNPDLRHPKNARSLLDTFSMLEHFTDVAGELGIAMKNDWMRVASQHDLTALEQERFGYEEFLKLWSLPERPEGLLVLHDIIARGAVTAIREKQVRVPEELKLAMHKNESIDLFCPMPATFVVSSEREIARALIEQVQKQFRGESCERISLPFKIVAHDNP